MEKKCLMKVKNYIKSWLYKSCLYIQTQLNRLILKQINFIGRSERNEGAAMFFIIEKKQETTFNFSQNSVSIMQNGNSKDHEFFKWFKQWRI